MRKERGQTALQSGRSYRQELACDFSYGYRDAWQWLLNCRVSNNVCGVKLCLSVLTRALRRARHFALVEGLPYQPRLARNRFRSGTQSDPCISSVTTSIMITTSNSPVKGSGIPTQLLGVLLHTIAISGLSRVRTELFQLLVIPSLAHHPVHLTS